MESEIRAIQKHIAKKIEIWEKENGYSKREALGKMRLTRMTYYRLTHCEIDPKLSTLCKVSKGLGKRTVEFFQ